MTHLGKWLRGGLLFLTLGSFLQCSSGTPDSACAETAAQYCAAYDRCFAGQTQALFGDAATCQARFALACKNEFFAPSTTATPESVVQCGKEIAGLQCGQDFGEARSCAPAGQLAAGAACGSDSQCASTQCRKTNSSGCGTCVARAKAGESCSSTSCEFGLTCGFQGGSQAKCVAAVAVGGACGAGSLCQTGSECVNSVCTKLSYGAEGAACGGAGMASCNPQQNLACNTVTKKCEAPKFVAAGEVCGTLASGSRAICTGGGSCKIMQGSANTGVCVAAAKDGAACDESQSINCLAPASCLAGTCQLPNASACK